MPLLAVGPASAAAVGGRLFTLCAGGTAAVLNGLIAFDVGAGTSAKTVAISFGAIAGVTVFAVLAATPTRRAFPDLPETNLRSALKELLEAPGIRQDQLPSRTAAGPGAHGHLPRGLS